MIDCTCPTAASGNFLQYINMEYSDGKLRIFTLEEFTNYELQETATLMSLRLYFVCTGEAKYVTFIQHIEAVNNFEPSFSASEYEIVIPTPLPLGLDITMFLLVRIYISTLLLQNRI